MLRRTTTPAGLSAIYSEGINLAEWHRPGSAAVRGFASELVRHNPNFSLRQVLPVDDDENALASLIPEADKTLQHARIAFLQDIRLLCDMYACLFELQQIGLRMTVLNRAMCPKFHVDHVVCRLICTYVGTGTEWLPESSVNREGPDLQKAADIQHVNEGHVALLKGESWPGNTGRGIVHRSPAASDSQPRLVMTLDPVA
ncbi:MAG: succinylglutamate desuccinylase [Gammaproteobacteria bacterium]|nr:succinylglutamate desuccinylase [Gammaproteobacteria bacterium]